jgi:ubiquinone/menaquinone biosynthesis C-methylase UbiE
LNLEKQEAESFAKYMKRYPGMYKTLVDILLKELHHTDHPFVILDVGCGPGLLFRPLDQLLPHSLVLGVDISPDMIQLADANNSSLHSSKVFLSVASSERLPFKDQSIDAIVSRFSLPYWNHPDSAFTEFVRILKPHGVMLLEALNGDFPTWKLQLAKYRMLLKLASKKVITYHIDAYKSAYSLDEIKTLVTVAQLQIERVIGTPSQWKCIIVAKKL